MGRFIRIVGVCAMLCGASAKDVKADPLFTDLTKNAQFLEETALVNYLLLGDLFGPSSGDVLTIAGNFSASGWSSVLTGSYLGMQTNITFLGTYDPASGSGSFTSTGTVGSSSVDGLGAWTWADVGDDEEDLSFSTSLVLATAIPPPPEWDWETAKLDPKTYKKIGESEGDDIIQDLGTLYETHFGQPTGLFQRESSFYFQPRHSGGIIEPVSASESATLGEASLTALESYPSDTVSGSVTIVPEPSSIFLLSTGLTISLLVCGCGGAGANFSFRCFLWDR